MSSSNTIQTQQSTRSQGQKREQKGQVTFASLDSHTDDKTILYPRPTSYRPGKADHLSSTSNITTSTQDPAREKHRSSQRVNGHTKSASGDIDNGGVGIVTTTFSDSLKVVGGWAWDGVKDASAWPAALITVYG